MSLKLKSFSQPDQLKRFQPEILVRLLEPFRLFFAIVLLATRGLHQHRRFRLGHVRFHGMPLFAAPFGPKASPWGV